MLLRQAVDAFLLSLEADGRSPRTVGSYRQRLAGLQRFVGERDVEELRPSDLDAWAASLYRSSKRYEDHPTRPTANGGLSPATVAGRIQSARTFFRWCVKRGHLDHSPARHLKRPRLEPSARSRVMNLDDLRRLMAEAQRRAKGGQTRDLALLRFLADTGCRVGEVITLRVARLNLTDCEAVVEGKTGRRIADFNQRTAEVLCAWLGDRPDVNHDFVFVNLAPGTGYGRPLTPGGTYQIFKRLARAANVTGRYNPQAIRHLVGQHFTDQVNLEIARQKLGHRDIETTARFYAHQDRKRVKEATRRHGLLSRMDD